MTKVFTEHPCRLNFGIVKRHAVFYGGRQCLTEREREREREIVFLLYKVLIQINSWNYSVPAYANNKVAASAWLPCSLVDAFVVRCIDIEFNNKSFPCTKFEDQS